MITKTPGAMCVFWNVFEQGVQLLLVNNHALAHTHTHTHTHTHCFHTSLTTEECV